MIAPRFLLTGRAHITGSPYDEILLAVPAGRRLRLAEWVLSYDSIVNGSLNADLQFRKSGAPTVLLAYCGIGFNNSPVRREIDVETPGFAIGNDLIIRFVVNTGGTPFDVSYQLGYTVIA
jgi:hypothetical protein